MFLLKDTPHTVLLMRLEPAAPQSRVKHSTTEPLLYRCNSLSCPPGQLAPRGASCPGGKITSPGQLAPRGASCPGEGGGQDKLLQVLLKVHGRKASVHFFYIWNLIFCFWFRSCFQAPTQLVAKHHLKTASIFQNRQNFQWMALIVSCVKKPCR